jgi:NAD-dependent DNA ligase
MNDTLYLKFGKERISSRQIDELIGLSRGLLADGKLNQAEIEFLQKWLVANLEVSDQPVVRLLYTRINEILSDGVVDEAEHAELFDALASFSRGDFELGEMFKASTLPITIPAPEIRFLGQHFCFTGTFNFGQRKDCENAVMAKGATVGSISKKTNFLVIGAYATDSWKHSTFGKKISQACEYRSSGIPISIVTEDHWRKFI